jgi:Putative restriction endonuclease
MKTVVLGEPPDVLSSLISQRQRHGLDLHDEIWDGDYHMAPAAHGRHGEIQALLVELLAPRGRSAGLTVTLEFNLGGPTNFRVPDLGVHRKPPRAVWIPTAAIVGEVRSPDDESYEKFGFYFDAGVEEILIVEMAPDNTSQDLVRWFTRGNDSFLETSRSTLLGIDTSEIAAFVALHSSP